MSLTLLHQRLFCSLVSTHNYTKTVCEYLTGCCGFCVVCYSSVYLDCKDRMRNLTRQKWLLFCRYYIIFIVLIHVFITCIGLISWCMVQGTFSIKCCYRLDLTVWYVATLYAYALTVYSIFTYFYVLKVPL